MTREARILELLETQRGVLVAEPAFVHRDMYTGRGVLADNTRPDAPSRDERGFLPVEWWVLSTTQAANNVPREGEGLTELRLPEGEHIALSEVVGLPEVFGDARDRWPLIKLLDIGGRPRASDVFEAPEVPPIPAHVHAGRIAGGRAQPPGKLEAYFFPPLGPRDVTIDDPRVVTRLGVRPGTRPDDFIEGLRAFGESDALYGLLREDAIVPLEGWTIRPGVIHAPGPWPTIEVQTPQDDYNLAAWQLGERLTGEARAEARERFQLRGLRSVEDFLPELVDWRTSAAPDFRARAHRPARTVASGRWGRRLRIFFDEFGGEALVLRPGGRACLPASRDPRALLVWAGEGEVQRRLAVSQNGDRELLLAPGHELEVANGGEGELWLMVIEPMRRRKA